MLAFSPGKFLQFRVKFPADIAVGDIDDGLQGFIARFRIGIVNEPQIIQKNFDLMALVKVQAVFDVVGNLMLTECLLYNPALKIGPIQDGDIPINISPALNQVSDLIHQIQSFTIFR